MADEDTVVPAEDKPVEEPVDKPVEEKPAEGTPAEQGTKIGEVKHYYSKISVAIVELEAPLKVGDKVKFVRGEDEFEQTVESMQVEHKDIEEAKAGDVIGLKVDQEAKEGAEVYKIE